MALTGISPSLSRLFAYGQPERVRHPRGANLSGDQAGAELPGSWQPPFFPDELFQTFGNLTFARWSDNAHSRIMQSRVFTALLFTALVSAPAWAQSSSGSDGTVPETMSGYHPSAGWTKNTGGDISQHSQPSTKSGGSSATYASRDETQLIQQKIASRRAQQATRDAKPPQSATPAASRQRP